MATLSMSPYAWAKAQYLRDNSDTEIGAFGISSLEYPLLVTDLWVPKQACTKSSIDLDRVSMQEHHERLLGEGYQYGEFDRIWFHTHPNGIGPDPSGTDLDTLAKMSTMFPWCVMLILAAGGRTHCTLSASLGKMKTRHALDVDVDWEELFDDSWDEGLEQVEAPKWAKSSSKSWSYENNKGMSGYSNFSNLSNSSSLSANGAIKTSAEIACDNRNNGLLEDLSQYEESVLPWEEEASSSGPVVTHVSAPAIVGQAPSETRGFGHAIKKATKLWTGKES